MNLKNYLKDSFGYERQYPIPDDYGKDVKVKNHEGVEYIIDYQLDKEGYREVTLDITSFLGSIGAVHYYGKFKSYIDFRKEGCKKGYSCLGYALKGVPKEYKDFLHVELCRPVDKRDILHSKNDRYYQYKEGDTTTGFWTEDELVKIAKKVFKEAFKGKWKLKIDAYTSKEYKSVKL